MWVRVSEKWWMVHLFQHNAFSIYWSFIIEFDYALSFDVCVLYICHPLQPVFLVDT